MRHLHAVLTALLLLASALAPLRGGASAPALVVVVVVSATSGLRDVSSADLRKLFLRNSSTIGGRNAVPLNQPAGTETRLLFDRKILGMSEAEAGRYWVDRRVRGESAAPRAIASAPLLRGVVAKLPGGIGYLRATDVDRSVRILTVDGKAPTQPGYALR